MKQTRFLLVSVSVSLLLPHIVTAQACVDKTTRLQQDNESAERVKGFVQYCWNGTWSTVCALGTENVTAVCRELGYQGGNSQLELRCMNKSSPGLIKLNCSDSTSSLHKCQVSNLETVPRDCGCNQESFRIHATIECHKGCADGEMRLDDCSTNSESRVEVCVNGRWGTVQAIQPIELAETVCSNYSLALKPFSYDTQPICRRSKPNYKCNMSDGMLMCEEQLDTDPPTVSSIVCILHDAMTTSDPSTRISTPTRPNWMEPNSTGTHEDTSSDRNSRIITPIVIVLAIMVAVVMVITFVVVWRRSTTDKQRNQRHNEETAIYNVLKHRHASSNTRVGAVDPTPVRDEGNVQHNGVIYSVLNVEEMRNEQHVLQSNQRLDPTPLNNREELCTYDIIDLEQTQQNKPTDPTPVRDETSKKEDDFYNAEKHTYAAVNKKKAKKTSEDGEGEREESQSYDSAMAGETLV